MIKNTPNLFLLEHYYWKQKIPKTNKWSFKWRSTKNSKKQKKSQVLYHFAFNHFLCIAGNPVFAVFAFAIFPAGMAVHVTFAIAPQALSFRASTTLVFEVSIECCWLPFYDTLNCFGSLFFIPILIFATDATTVGAGIAAAETFTIHLYTAWFFAGTTFFV